MKPRITRNTRMGTEILHTVCAESDANGIVSAARSQLSGDPIVAAVPRQFTTKEMTR